MVAVFADCFFVVTIVVIRIISSQTDITYSVMQKTDLVKLTWTSTWTFIKVFLVFFKQADFAAISLAAKLHYVYLLSQKFHSWQPVWQNYGWLGQLRWQLKGLSSMLWLKWAITELGDASICLRARYLLYKGRMISFSDFVTWSQHTTKR